jgi:hypothetical protein
VASALLLAGCGQQEAAASPHPPAVRACRTADLQVSPFGVGIAAGTAMAQFDIQNRSGAGCVVQGFMTVQMLSHGLPIPTNSSHDVSEIVQPVVLAAGGRGSFRLRWASRCAPSAINTPTDWQVTPPGEQSGWVVSAQGAGGSVVPVCDNAVRVGPIRSGPAGQ